MARCLLLVACVAVCLAGVLSAKATHAPHATHAPRPPTPPPADLVTVLTQMGNFSQILYLINQAGLTAELMQEPNVTYFLPTDAALARLPVDTLNQLGQHPDQLKALLQYHVVYGKQKRLAVKLNDVVLNSTRGLPVRINSYINRPSKIITAEGVPVVQDDIHVANGYVHAIDGLMTPPEGTIHSLICGRADLSTMCSLANQTGVFNRIDRDKDITVFCPTNAAFSKLSPQQLNYLTNGNHTGDLKQTLLYHLVQETTLYSKGMRQAMTFNTSDSSHDPLMVIERGNDLYLNHAHVTEKDVSAYDGVMHVIDEVLIPTSVLLKMERNAANAIVG